MPKFNREKTVYSNEPFPWPELSEREKESVFFAVVIAIVILEAFYFSP